MNDFSSALVLDNIKVPLYTFQESWLQSNALYSYDKLIVNTEYNSGYHQVPVIKIFHSIELCVIELNLWS